MRHTRFLASLLLTSAAATAQLSITTTFADDNGGSADWCNFFDLTANVGIAVTQMDVNVNSGAGTAGSIEVYSRSGSYVGNTLSPAGWTLLGTAPIAASNARGTPTPATFATPLTIPPGSHGICVHYVGVGMAYTNGNGANQTYSTPEVTLNLGESTAGFFTGTQFTPRVWNGTIYYTPGTGGAFASSTPFGTGCPDEVASFYEEFPQTTFDLGGTPGNETVFNVFFTGAGYVGFPGGGSWRTPSAALTLGDDTVQTMTLPFTLPYPGGSTNVIGVCSNGYLWFGNDSIADYTPSPAELLSQGPRFAPMWTDLNPNSGGTVYFDVDAASGLAWITYDAVAEFGAAANTSTFQVVLNASGNIDLFYRGVAVTNRSALVGWSPGNGAIDPGAIDLSAGLPIFTGLDRIPLEIRSTRPVEGQLLTINVTNVPQGAGLGALLISGAQIPGGATPPIPGMDGCSQYVGPGFEPWYFFPPGTQHSETLPRALPAGVFTGQHLYMQAVVFAPGANTAGLIASNGLDLLIDVN